MNDKENVKQLENIINLIGDCLSGKKGTLSGWRIEDLFYNDEKKKKYKWLHIIQLIGLGYTAQEIGDEIGYSASTVENQKEQIKYTIEQINGWEIPPLIIEKYKTTKINTTPIIKEFAKQYEADIILLLEKFGERSYISIGEHIVNEVKLIFNLED